MKPTLVQYDAPGWGVGELWLDEDSRVFHSELPRPGRPSLLRAGSEAAQTLVLRLQAFFAGDAVSFDDVPLRLDAEGFYADCAHALLTVTRGEVVTYGELAALAGYPGAARAAGTFCARCDLAPFLPVHRVISANGLGSWGDLGVAYKKRLLELEHVTL